MTATEFQTIILGGVSYPVTPFTFDQLRRLLPAFAQLQDGLADGGLDAAYAILSIALEEHLEGHGLDQLRMTMPEILLAIPVVASVSGLTELGEMIKAGR